MTDELQALIKKAVAEFNALSEHEQLEIRRQQRESFVRAEMSWPDGAEMTNIWSTKDYSDDNT